MADVFGGSETPVAGTVDSLVGEGKKFKTVDDLAKSKVEADNFIETLKAEVATARVEKERIAAELEARKTVQEQIEALRTTKVVPDPVASPTGPKAGEGKVVTDEDLNKRIRATLEAEKNNDLVTANVTSVENKLIEIYGSAEKAKEVVEAKARELKVSTKFLESTAAQSPDAFYSLVGLTKDQASGGTPGVTRSDVNTEGFRNLNTANQPAPGTYAAMRAKQGTSVKALMDPAYLLAAHEAALKDPDKFFSAA